MSEISISEPDWSSTFDDVLEIDMAHSFWSNYANEMASARTLTEANAPALEHLVILRVLVQRALRECVSKGTVVMPKKANAKGMVRTSPHVNVAATLGRQAVAIEDALGLSPGARNRAGQVKPAAPARRPSDEFLKPRGEHVVPFRRGKR